MPCCDVKFVCFRSGSVPTEAMSGRRASVVSTKSEPAMEPDGYISEGSRIRRDGSHGGQYRTSGRLRKANSDAGSLRQSRRLAAYNADDEASFEQQVKYLTAPPAATSGSQRMSVLGSKGPASATVAAKDMQSVRPAPTQQLSGSTNRYTMIPVERAKPVSPDKRQSEPHRAIRDDVIAWNAKREGRQTTAALVSPPPPPRRATQSYSRPSSAMSGARSPAQHRQTLNLKTAPIPLPPRPLALPLRRAPSFESAKVGLAVPRPGCREPSQARMDQRCYSGMAESVSSNASDSRQREDQSEQDDSKVLAVHANNEYNGKPDLVKQVARENSDFTASPLPLWTGPPKPAGLPEPTQSDTRASGLETFLGRQLDSQGPEALPNGAEQPAQQRPLWSESVRAQAVSHKPADARTTPTAVHRNQPISPLRTDFGLDSARRSPPESLATPIGRISSASAVPASEHPRGRLSSARYSKACTPLPFYSQSLPADDLYLTDLDERKLQHRQSRPPLQESSHIVAQAAEAALARIPSRHLTVDNQSLSRTLSRLSLCSQEPGDRSSVNYIVNYLTDRQRPISRIHTRTSSSATSAVLAYRLSSESSRSRASLKELSVDSPKSLSPVDRPPRRLHPPSLRPGDLSDTESVYSEHLEDPRGPAIQSPALAPPSISLQHSDLSSSSLAGSRETAPVTSRPAQRTRTSTTPSILKPLARLFSSSKHRRDRSASPAFGKQISAPQPQASSDRSSRSSGYLDLPAAARQRLETTSGQYCEQSKADLQPDHPDLQQSSDFARSNHARDLFALDTSHLTPFGFPQLPPTYQSALQLPASRSDYLGSDQASELDTHEACAGSYEEASQTRPRAGNSSSHNSTGSQLQEPPSASYSPRRLSIASSASNLAQASRSADIRVRQSRSKSTSSLLEGPFSQQSRSVSREATDDADMFSSLKGRAAKRDSKRISVGGSPAPEQYGPDTDDVSRTMKRQSSLDTGANAFSKPINGRATAGSNYSQRQAPSPSTPRSQSSGTLVAPTPPRTSEGSRRGVAPNGVGAVHDMNRVISLLSSRKFYTEGYVWKRDESRPDGSIDAAASGSAWDRFFMQLTGSELSLWNVRDMEEAARNNTTIPPVYIKITDAFVVLARPEEQFQFVFALNTAGSNRILFACETDAKMTRWMNNLRLASWELGRLAEVFTGTLLGLRGFGQRASPLTKGVMDGMVNVRLPGETEWQLVRLVLHENPPEKKRRSLLPSMTRSASLSQLSSEGEPEVSTGTAYLYASRKAKRPFMTLSQAWYCASVYPEVPQLVDATNIFKVEACAEWDETGEQPSKLHHAHYLARSGSRESGQNYILAMPAEGGQGEMLDWITGFCDAFKLYGRPREFVFDPRNPISQYFVVPIGPSRDRLFFDSQLVEHLDVRENRPREIQASFKDMLVQRMRGRAAEKRSSGKPALGSLPRSNTDSDIQAQARQHRQIATGLPAIGEGAIPEEQQGRSEEVQASHRDDALRQLETAPEQDNSNRAPHVPTHQLPMLDLQGDQDEGLQDHNPSASYVPEPSRELPARGSPVPAQTVDSSPSSRPVLAQLDTHTSNRPLPGSLETFGRRALPVPAPVASGSSSRERSPVQSVSKDMALSSSVLGSTSQSSPRSNVAQNEELPSAIRAELPKARTADVIAGGDARTQTARISGPTRSDTKTSDGAIEMDDDYRAALSFINSNAQATPPSVTRQAAVSQPSSIAHKVTPTRFNDGLLGAPLAATREPSSPDLYGDSSPAVSQGIARQPSLRAPSPSSSAAPTISKAVALGTVTARAGAFGQNRRTAERAAAAGPNLSSTTAARTQPGRTAGKSPVPAKASWSSDEDDGVPQDDDSDDDSRAQPPSTAQARQSSLPIPDQRQPSVPDSMPGRFAGQQAGGPSSYRAADPYHSNASVPVTAYHRDSPGQISQPASERSSPAPISQGVRFPGLSASMSQPAALPSWQQQGRNSSMPQVGYDRDGRPMTVMGNSAGINPHGLLGAANQTGNTAKQHEQWARQNGQPLVQVEAKSGPPRSGLVGAIAEHERERKREGGVGATITERQRREVDEHQYQQQQQQQMMLMQQQQQQQLAASQGMFGSPFMGGMMPFAGMPGMPAPGAGYDQNAMMQQQMAMMAAQQAFMAAMSSFGQQPGAFGQQPGAFGQQGTVPFMSSMPFGYSSPMQQPGSMPAPGTPGAGSTSLPYPSYTQPARSNGTHTPPISTVTAASSQDASQSGRASRASAHREKERPMPGNYQ
ncbi:uncharacterized protein L969DRAFT_608006 [Mixia osmundae IAM 14324]|uniref:uncharacterized protein n=1 Tax=Mixia osmundae (strain CBS 9802 / IAM 14324 / JCM 22182 / KY 12970) TaxID=764103 RepID=UPI0004A5550A|nr:uncharacterized protein L969DRAFT_608006 [Mixia osmundae IAM 14324]KEI42698.1 hypothetical protein L969DRAFT_608006 [Mixia osmundae IAM 14324]